MCAQQKTRLQKNNCACPSDSELAAEKESGSYSVQSISPPARKFVLLRQTETTRSHLIAGAELAAFSDVPR